jgi:hypothetical protein
MGQQGNITGRFLLCFRHKNASSHRNTNALYHVSQRLSIKTDLKTHQSPKAFALGLCKRGVLSQ